MLYLHCNHMYSLIFVLNLPCHRALAFIGMERKFIYERFSALGVTMMRNQLKPKLINKPFVNVLFSLTSEILDYRTYYELGQKVAWE